MRPIACLLTLCFVSCGWKALKECEGGRALPPSQHLQRCAGLITAPACRHYVSSLDGGRLDSWEFADRCKREYCGRFSRAVPFCSGARGTPATHYEPEVDFLRAVFEADHGAASGVAMGAFLEAVRRDHEARAEAADQERHLRRREARLILDLEGDRQTITLTFVRPGGAVGFSGPVAALGPERCGALVTSALDGGSLQGKPVFIRSSKAIMFRSIRCVMEAAIDAGASADDIEFSTH